MKRHDKLAETIPYGTLGILALEERKSTTTLSAGEPKGLNAMLQHPALQATTGNPL